MEIYLTFWMELVTALGDHATALVSLVSGWDHLAAGLGAYLAAGAIAAEIVPGTGPGEGARAAARRWHGTIDERYANVDTLLRVIKEHAQWAVPATIFPEIYTLRDKLRELISRCKSPYGSSADREERDALLSRLVHTCTKELKIWAQGMVVAGTMTLDQLHAFGFFMPGETSGHKGRGPATHARAMVKAAAIDADHASVVVDGSLGENAGQVASGWPPDADYILIVILAEDGVTEVFRTISSRLHNEVRMPADCHGKMYIAKASFLRHPDDEPHFGNEQTFLMPRTSSDVIHDLQDDDDKE